MAAAGRLGRPVHLLQVAVAPPTLVGYLTAGATPVWLLGSFAEVLTKRALAERVYADLSADGASVTSAQLATAAGLSPSDARALVAEFLTRPPAVIHGNGHLDSGRAMATADHGRSP